MGMAQQQNTLSAESNQLADQAQQKNNNQMYSTPAASNSIQ